MNQIMQRCGGCRRHVAAQESVCPFCRRSVGLVGGASTIAASAAVVIVVSTMLFACGEPSDGDDAADTTGATANDSSGAAEATQGMSNTSTPTVTDASSSGFDTGVDDSTTEIDTDMTAGGFIYGAPDGGGVTLECDVFEQDCPKGEKCQPWANDGGPRWNATRCSPLGGAAEVGDPCAVEGNTVSGIDTCALGALCWVLDAEALSGVCVAQCSGSAGAPECTGGLACAIIEPTIVNVCASTCGPASPTCAGEEVCTPIGDIGYCLPDATGDG